MKIGVDGRELLKNQITGTGRFLSNFLKYAPGFRPGWKFIIFGNQYTFFQFDFPNLKKIIIPEKSTIFWDQIKLPKFLKRERIDVFFSPYYKAPIFSPCPTVITIHDITPFIRLENMEYTLQPNALLMLWSKFMAKRARKIITVSNHSKKNIMNIFKIPEEKIEVVYEGVEDEFRPKVRDEIEKVKMKYGINRKYVLYIGNFEHHKNVDGLIKAYSGLPAELRKEYFLVVGGKDEKNSPGIEKLSGELGVRENIFFPGFIEEDDLPSIYGGAEIFIFPSFYEGFGLPPLEAMACGIPVIASNVSSLPEVVGDAGSLVDPKDIYGLTTAIKELLTDASVRYKMREKGLKRAKLFQAGDTTQKILNVF